MGEKPMPRWRAYRTLEWFIFAGFALASFFALVAVVTLVVVSRSARVAVWQQPQVSLTPTQSPVSIAGWQTYRNEELGFAIDYPAGWTLREGEKGPIFFVQVVTERDGVTIIPGGEIGFLPPENLVYDDLLAGRPAGVVEWRVDGDYAHKFIYFQEPAGFYLQLSHQLLAGEEFRGASPVLEKILSTFRFIK